MKKILDADQMVEEVLHNCASHFASHRALDCKVPEFDYCFGRGWEFEQDTRCPRYLHLPAERAM